MTKIIHSAILSLALAAPAAAQTAAERLELPEPAAREGRTLSIDGAEIFVSESGAGDAIVLLHGYPLSGALFERVRGALDDDHRVVTVDHRGYGNSTAPAAVTDVATYASDALAAMDELGIETAVIGGMSMGGPILFEMFRQDPDAFRAAILIDTNHTPANAIERGIWDGAHATLEEAGEVGAIVPFLLPNMLTGATRLEVAPAQADYLKAVIAQASLEGALGGAAVLADRPDSTATLEAMDVPVLVLVGQEDPVYAVEVSQMMVDAAPDAMLAVIPGASHAAVFEAPEAAAAAMLDFVAGLD